VVVLLARVGIAVAVELLLRNAGQFLFDRFVARLVVVDHEILLIR
jgi:hypothetical protein